MTLVFTADDAWKGGSYELALELPPEPARIRRVVEMLWAHSSLRGCYATKSLEPDALPLLDPRDPRTDFMRCLYGVANFATGAVVPVSSQVIAVADEPAWVYFGAPLGGLGRHFPVGAFPFEDGGDLSWRSVIDDWLRDVAEHIFKSERFDLGLVGWVDLAPTSAEEIRRDGLPERRWMGYLVPEPTRLAWYPSTEGSPITLSTP